MILYIEYLIEFNEKLLELTSSSRLQKQDQYVKIIVFLYTKNKQYKNKIKKTILSIIASKGIKASYEFNRTLRLVC